MKGSEFIFDSVDLLYYHLQKTSLGRIGSWYIDSSKWPENKKATKNSTNNDNNCFQYAITAALNYQNIKSHPGIISNLNPYKNKYDWRGIDFTSHLKAWKEFELNNKSISLNILFAPYNTERIRRAYPQKKQF